MFLLSKYFDYDPSSSQSDYYEMLDSFIDTWESEIIEFKEGRNNYDFDKMGRYFSALSNEANLRGQQSAWFIMGISESKEIVGTSFKNGEKSLLEKFKYKISQFVNNNMTFSDIIELYPIVDNKNKRVLLFKIPAALNNTPTSWKNEYYARSGESLITLPQYKIDKIRHQERYDWSRQIIKNSNISFLDKDAIHMARKNYLEKMNRPHIKEEVENLSDEDFLKKLRLIIDGNLTNTALLLLGKPEYDYLLSSMPKVMWRLYGDSDGLDLKDYELFSIPFINIAERVNSRIRNLTYRYIPSQLTLFPKETAQYDSWLLRELINNCLAHSDYLIGSGRIFITEYNDKIEFKNPGSFIPGDIQSVLKAGYNSPFYRNQLLAESMVNFNMIDTATSGIKRVYKIQKDKFFPLPDYYLTENEVSVTIYGKILDEKYAQLLCSSPSLSLETVFLLDRVQKGQSISKDEISFLRKNKLVEGRSNNLIISLKVSSLTDNKTTYIKNKGFDDKYYKDLIIEYLSNYREASKNEIKELLWNKLPDILTDSQKNTKISSLLTSLRKNNIIKTNSTNKQLSKWILVNNKND